MRRLLVYVLVIAGGVLIASCMGPRTLTEWRRDLRISDDALITVDPGFHVVYSGTDAEGNRSTGDGPTGKRFRDLRFGDEGFPEFYAAEVASRMSPKVHENLFFEWDGKAFGVGRTTSDRKDLTAIVIDKPYFGEDLSLSETMIIAVYEPFELSAADSERFRVATADTDPAALLALMLAEAGDYYCIKCGGQKVCAVNPVCP